MNHSPRNRSLLWLLGAALVVLLAACGTAGTPQATLTVNVTGDGAVTSDPAGIDTTTADGDTTTFDEGTDVTLTAAPAAGSAFGGWSGCDTQSGTTCTVTMDADATVDVTFDLVSGSLAIPITQGSDDAEELLNGSGTNPTTFPAGHTYTHSSDLEMTYDDGTNPGAQLVGLRFQDVTVPAGATITQASITFTANNDSAGAVTLVIAAQADVNPATFNDDADEDATSDLSTRALTTETQSWTPGDWTGNLDYDTPDLSAIVQEIVDTAGWTSGNPIAFIIDGPEAAPLRRAFAYDFDAGQFAAVLNVDFDVTP